MKVGKTCITALKRLRFANCIGRYITPKLREPEFFRQVEAVMLVVKPGHLDSQTALVWGNHPPFSRGFEGPGGVQALEKPRRNGR